MIKTYTLLTKPGIIMGNAVTAAAGFALAARGQFNFLLFLLTLLGLGGVIASACVFNCIIDRIPDAKMGRTKNRPLVRGLITPKQAFVYATMLGALGFAILIVGTNIFAVAAAFIGFIVYVPIYTILKHRTALGTVIGSVAGAMPPVVGYIAAGAKADLGALLLFSILVLWQMPHFYAIALYHYADYAAAKIPVLPVARGAMTAKVHITLYLIAFQFAALSLYYFGYTGKLYLFTALSLGLGWFALSLIGFYVHDNARWGKQMFAFSLVVVMGLCVTMSI